MKRNRFYMACLRDTVGNNVAFHAKNGHGYVTDIRKAHVYTRAEAQAAWNMGRIIDLPLSAHHVDALKVLHVDHQYIDHSSKDYKFFHEYVAYQKGRWNGNDLYFLTDSGGFDCDYSKAITFSNSHELLGISEDIEIIPKILADSVARPTFQVFNINLRLMIQAAGIVIPDYIKMAKRRKSTGLTRWNCPECGKFSWQYDPHEFHGCKDRACSEFIEIKP